MSTIIMSQCWPLQMSPAQKAVLISLSDNANDEGVCWPSIARISQRTCLSARAVQTAIRWLIENNVLAAAERYGRSTVYTVSPDKFAPLQELHPAGNAPTPAAPAPQPPQMPHPTPAAPAPRTVKEPQVEPSKESNSNFVAEIFDHWRMKMSKPRSKLDDKRKRLIAKALENYEVADLKLAIDGCAGSPWHMGTNDRKTKYNDIELILRDASKIDGFIDKAERPPVAPKQSGITKDFSQSTYQGTPDDQFADFLQ